MSLHLQPSTPLQTPHQLSRQHQNASDGSLFNLYNNSNVKTSRDLRPLTTARVKSVRRRPGTSDLKAAHFERRLSSVKAAEEPQSVWNRTASGEETIPSFRLPQDNQLRVSHSYASVFKPDFANRYHPKPLTEWSNSPVQQDPSEKTTASGEVRNQEDLTDTSRPQSRPCPLDLHRQSATHSSYAHEQRKSTENTVSHSLKGADKTPPTRSIFSNTSTFSLSKFPHPPNIGQHTPPSSSEGTSQIIASTTPTATVYHVRGASFEIINPHQSLVLENIETPAEAELQQEDYFGTGTTSALPANRKNPSMTPTRIDVSKPDNSNAKATPPRSLFEDLPSAYTSITARSYQKQHNANQFLNELPLPPVPVPVREAAPVYEGFKAHESSVPKVARLAATGLSASSPFGMGYSRTKDLAEVDEDYASNYRTNAQLNEHLNPGQGALNITAGPISDGIEVARGNRMSASKATNLSQHYHDDNWIYQTSSRGASGALYPASLHQFDGMSHKPSSNGRESSSNEFLDAYGYDYSKSSDPSFQSGKDEARMQGYPASETTSKLDSTIGEIIERYKQINTSYQFDADLFPADAAIPFDSSRSTKRLQQEHPFLAASPGVNQSDAALDNKIVHKHCSKGSNHVPATETRVATARALGLTPGFGPTVPLPSDPSMASANQYLGLGQFSVSESPSWVSSYGETEKLLAGSQRFLPLDPSRSAESTDSGLPRKNSPVHVAETQANFAINDTVRVSHSSQLTLEDIITRDLRHLSGISGLSNLSGSVYILNSPADAAPEQESSRQSERLRYHSNESSSSVRNDDQHEDTRHPSSAKCLPIAAFPQSAVVPGFWRLSRADREALNQHANNANTANQFASPRVDGRTDAADEHDWETIKDSQTFEESASSFADYSSSTSLNGFAKIGVHPGDKRYQHRYRVHSPTQSNEEPVLLPSYDFRGGAGFPHRNALTPPTPALYNTYRHPSPLPVSHPNPFSSSPPQLTGSAISGPLVSKHKSDLRSQEESSHLPTFSRQRPNLSVVYEQTGELQGRPNSRLASFAIPRQTSVLNANRDPTPASENPASQVPAGIPFDMLALDSSTWLSSEPGPEISHEAKDGSANLHEGQLQGRSTVLSSGLDTGLLRVLREGDPHVASSPLSNTNSFAKLSLLGPKGNITGTPNGTGMREVGSSIVGSSSPFVMSSSPPFLENSSPTTTFTPDHNEHQPAWGTPLVRPSSPSAQYNESHYRHAGEMLRKKDFGSQHGSMLSASRIKNHGSQMVRNQTHLREMRLGSRDNGTISTHTTTHGRNPSERGVGYRVGSSINTDRPLLPFTREQPSAHILERYRSPSSHASHTRKKKQLISWSIFAICCFFPPFLVMYAHGLFDKTLSAVTNGDIRRMGQRQKRYAIWGGYGGSTLVVLALVVTFVVVRTVPNTLP